MDSIDETWAGLSEDTRLFLRVSCLFDTERIPKRSLSTLLRGEGWDEDLFDIAFEEAQQQALIRGDAVKLSVPRQVVAFVRRQTSPSLPESLIDAHLEGLWTAARVVCSRTADAAATEAFLDYPLEREDWDGIGRDIDVALTAMASTIGRAIVLVDRTGRRTQALSWFLRALPDVEAAAAEADVNTREGVELVTNAWHLVAQMATLHDEITGDDEARIRVAAEYIQKAAEAAGRLFDAASGWRETCGMHWATLAQRMRRLDRQEEARVHYTRAVELLAEFWTREGVPMQSILDSRIILVESLVSLGREQEAFAWFDRAQSSARLGTDDWVRRAKLAKTAFQLGQASFRAEDGGRPCIEWLERASALNEGLEVRTMDDDMDLGQSLFMTSVVRMQPLLAIPGPMPARVEPWPGLDMEQLAVALSSIDRFLAFVKTAADHLNVMLGVFGAQALDLGASGHHHAGRAAEAIAMFERADAIREKLDEEFRISDGREVERWLIRGRCLRAVGRMEEAGRAFVRGLEEASEQVYEQKNEWMEWERDDSALEIAQIHTEIEAIRDEAGVAEILRALPLSPLKTRATAHMFRAFVAAESDQPSLAAAAFLSGEAEEGDTADDRAFFRVKVAVTHAIALSFARSAQVEEALDWASRVYAAYSGLPPRPPSENRRRELLARRTEGESFEAFIDNVAHDVLMRTHRFAMDLLSGALLREVDEEGKRNGLIGDGDEDDEEDDEDETDEEQGS